MKCELLTELDQIEKLINAEEFFNIQQLDIYLNKIKISNKTVRCCHQWHMRFQV